jgi:hypothetical protein
MTRRLVLTTAMIVAFLLAITVGAASAITIPRVPVMPKLTQYNATLDVAGYVVVRQAHDDTSECAPGRDVLIEYEALVELGKPRPVKVSVMNARVTSTFANNPGGAIHLAKVINYRGTNYCPPTQPDPSIVRPACTRNPGKLRAFLTPTPSRPVADDDPTPLVTPVSLVLTRVGGGTQQSDCLSFLSRLRPSVGLHVLHVLEVPAMGMIVPAGFTDAAVLKLRKGKALRRSIRLNGACDHVLLRTGSATAADLNAFSQNCTVTGRIYVQLKRV